MAETKRIAFVTEPKGNKDAEERLHAYKNQLQEAGIHVDPDLIYTGNFTYESGVEAVKTLLDERHVQFEALIASNDNMVLGAKEELERRGYSIPDTEIRNLSDKTKHNLQQINSYNNHDQ